jgi:uncharacterized repeat protein (TIGR01451 family)
MSYYILRSASKKTKLVTSFALALLMVFQAFGPGVFALKTAQANIGNITLSGVTGSGTGPYFAFGIWDTINGQPCWNNGGNFRYFIDVFRDLDHSNTYTAGDIIVQTVNPAACNGDFSGTVSNDDKDDGGNWPATGQTGSPANFTLTPGSHFICSVLRHINERGNDIVATDCLDTPVVVPPTDVCPNIDGVQATLPDGMILQDGQCVTPPPPPVDMCPNIDGNQETIPQGMIVNNEGQCVQPPVDVCPNLDGLQTVVPEGYVLNDSNQCVLPPPPPTDLCPNIDGTQETIPDGLIVNNEGQCVQPPVDVCPNLDGLQTVVPEGYVLNDSNQCVLPPPPPTDLCPNIDGVQATIPDGMILQDGQCVTPPPPPTDVCSNIDGLQTVVPEGMTLNDGQCLTTDVVVTDPALVKTIDNGAPAPGATIVYTLVVSNSSSIIATNVTVTDPMPTSVTYVSDDAAVDADTTFDTNTKILTWNIPSIPANGSVTLHVTATVNSDATGSVANTASIISGATEGDSDTTNDSSTASATVTTTTTTTTTTGGGGGCGPLGCAPGAGISGGGGGGGGSVLGASTGGAGAPEVLGAFAAAPGLPNTGNGSSSQTIAITLSLIASLIAVNVVGLRLVRKDQYGK